MPQPEHSRQEPVPLFCAASAAQGIDLTETLRQVVESQRYVLGPCVLSFEEAFAPYVGVSHAVGVGNGTEALSIALRGLGVVPGDRVLTVANAGFYASTAIRGLGAVPVYVDVDPHSLNMDPAALAEALGRSGKAGESPVRAVVVTHLYGFLADMPALSRLCSEAGVPLVEDCAQAHGALREGRRAGAWGDVGCFSFYPTKNLGALGDGGAVVTANPELAARLRSLRQYGWGAKYEVTLEGGVNSRLDELQAAVLLAKLPWLDAANARRRDIAVRYTSAFAGWPLQLPQSGQGAGLDQVAHLYVLRTARRDALRTHLTSRGIASDIHYPVPDHRQPVQAAAYAQVELPVTETACAQVLTLPCFPGMTDEQVARVIRAVNEFHEGA